MNTRIITQKEAIDRIVQINFLIRQKKYRTLESVTFEPEFELALYVDTFEPLDVTGIDEWTNRMLGDQMDEPFFRYTPVENYEVIDANL